MPFIVFSVSYVRYTLFTTLFAFLIYLGFFFNIGNIGRIFNRFFDNHFYIRRFVVKSFLPPKMTMHKHIQEQVKHLHGQGVSQRGIAARLNVSRTTIQKYLRRIKHQTSNVGPDGIVYPSLGWTENKAERCPTCGGKAVLPCFACQLRERLRNRTGLRRSDD